MVQSRASSYELSRRYTDEWPGTSIGRSRGLYMTTNPSLFTFLTAWTLQPSVLLGIALAAVIYGAGLRELERRGRLWSLVQRRHVASFALGLIALLVALQSPLDTYDSRLFTIHMVQHLILLMVAPPLLLLGKPIPVLLMGLPPAVVRRVARAHARTSWLNGLTGRLTSPPVAWTLYVGDVLLWHVPALYQATLFYPGVHLLEHMCFLSTGLVFWWVIIEPMPGPARVHHGVRMAMSWSAVLPMVALGALFTFPGSLWYPWYAAQPRLWGLSAIDDQHIGGLIMWLPGSMMHVIGASILFFAMLARDERAAMDEGLGARG
jgi:putative membrane protein